MLNLRPLARLLAQEVALDIPDLVAGVGALATPVWFLDLPPGDTFGEVSRIVSHANPGLFAPIKPWQGSPGNRDMRQFGVVDDLLNTGLVGPGQGGG